MITCPECGARNEDGELFCGNCGTYLEWEDERPAATTPAATPAAATDAGSDGGTGVGTEAPPAPAAPAASPEPAAAPEQVEPAATSAPAEAAPTGAERPAGRGGGHAESALRSTGVATPRVPGGGSSPAGSVKRAAASKASQATHQTTSNLASSLGLPPMMAGRAGSVASSLGRGARRRRNAKGAQKQAEQAEQAEQADAAEQPEHTEHTEHTEQATSAESVETPARPPAAAPAPSAEPAATAPSTGTGEAARAQATIAGGAGGAVPTRSGPAPVKPAAARAPAAVPAPVKPQAPKPRRHVEPARTEEPPPAPGELICGACGAGNAPHRKFCRRCGASLQDAPVQGKAGWWQRRKQRRAARRSGPTAGTRPTKRRRRFPVKTVVVLVILALAGAAGWHYRSDLANGYNVVLDRVSGNQVVNPVAATASSSADGHSADLARDGVNTNYWAPDVTGGGEGEWIEFTFAEPFRLVHVLLTSGASTEDKARLAQARPSKVRFSATTSDGRQQIEDVPVADVGTAQELLLRFDDVTTLRMTVLSSYPAKDKDPDQYRVAVAEVEFRGR